MNNVTIYMDHWEVLLATTLLVREGQETRIVMTPDDPLVLRVRFKSTPPKAGEKLKPRLSIEGAGNDGVLTFTDWNNSLGAAIKEPLEFAADDQGRQIAVMCSVWKIGEAHQVFLQFMRRGLP